MPRAYVKDLDYVFNRLSRVKKIVYDCETTGLSWINNVICGHVVSFSANPADSWYLPIGHETGNNLDAEKINKELIKHLNRQELKIVGHNLAFDLKFLSKIGHDLSAQYEDTMINAPILDEYQAKFSLEWCAMVANVQAKKSTKIYNHIQNEFPEVTKNQMGHFWRLSADDPMVTEYACGDGTTTWQLCDWQAVKLQEEDLLKVWAVECKLIPILVRMSIKGVKIDTEYLDKLENYVSTQIEKLENEFPEGFNSKAPTQMRALFEDNGITDWPLTPTGQPSFNSMFLEKSDLGKKVIALRKLLTMQSMFITPLKEEHIVNGRVHTTFNQLRGDGFGVVTGRISMANPNLGQVPKRDKLLGPLFRAAFVPDANKIWGDVDWSQAEPRLLAYYSRCRVLLDDYRNNPNADAHQAVADAAGIERHWGKHANMTIINSGGANVLIQKYHVPADKAEGLLRSYFEALPEVKKLQINAGYKMKQVGYVRTLLWRKARLNEPRKAYTAVNRLLQGGNADCMKLKLVEIDQYLASEGRPVDMLNTVYDSISFQFTKESENIYRNCLGIMNYFGQGCVIELDVPFKSDSHEGENWAVATYGDEVRPSIEEVKNLSACKSSIWSKIEADD